MMSTSEIICPLYEAEGIIEKLDAMLKAQKNLNLLGIRYILTQSNDHTEEILKRLKASYSLVKKDDFSHSLTREEAIFSSKADYAILVSQDVILKDVHAMEKLLSFAEENHLAGAYGRQISTAFLDKYFRMYSYPEESHVYGLKEYGELGQGAIFFSDVFSVLDVKEFKNQNGYDHKRLNTNEDMYYADKCLKKDLKMGYASDAVVYHSHQLSLSSTYRRYREIGRFFEENEGIDALKKGGASHMKIVSLMLKHFALLSLIVLPFNVAARLLGMKRGRKDIKISRKGDKKL